MRKLADGMTMAAFAAAVLMVAPWAQAQSSTGLRVTIPFSFVAGGKDLPAGEYVFSKAVGPNLITVASSSGKERLHLRIRTSLARVSAEDEHLLAFDKIGGKRILSEVWLPNQQGAAVAVSRGEHDHDVIKLTPRTAMR
jgi:hypothetical protein